MWYSWNNKPQKKAWALALSPVLGLITYMEYLKATTADPLAFVHAQSGFLAGRSMHLILLPQVYWRYLKILALAPLNFSYFVALCEVWIFTVMLIAGIFALMTYWRKNHIFFPLALFSLVSILLPTVTGTLLSTPRFALLCISSFLFIADTWSRNM